MDARPFDLRRTERDDVDVIAPRDEVLDPAPGVDVGRISEIAEAHRPALPFVGRQTLVPLLHRQRVLLPQAAPLDNAAVPLRRFPTQRRVLQ